MAAKRKPGVILYIEHAKMGLLLPREEQARLFEAVIQYADTGALPDGFTGALFICFNLLRDDIDRYKDRYEKTCERNRAIAKKRIFLPETDDQSLPVVPDVTSGDQSYQSLPVVPNVTSGTTGTNNNNNNNNNNNSNSNSNNNSNSSNSISTSSESQGAMDVLLGGNTDELLAFHRRG